MSDLLDALGVDLPDELLTLALTHRSYAYEHGGLPTNERLEFLGDAILNCSVARLLFDARDIGRIKPLKPGQPEAVKNDAGRHKGASPIDVFHSPPSVAARLGCAKRSLRHLPPLGLRERGAKFRHCTNP